MSIFFNKVERVNPQKRDEAKKWYPSLKTVAQLQQREVAKEIADETTLNPKEAEMALEQLQKVLIRNLLVGNSVQLGDWGSFSLTCSGAPAESKEELTATNIKGLKIHFTPGKTLKNALMGASFKPAESMVSITSSLSGKKQGGYSQTS
jgi:predicted histone-like DNA-binding protein